MPEAPEQSSNTTVIEKPADETTATTDVGELLGAEPRTPRQILHSALTVIIPLLIIAGAIFAVHPGHRGAQFIVTDWILVGVIVVALAFDYVNGMNDAANAIATVVSTRVLPPMIALGMAAVLNFVGALVSTKVANTIVKGIFVNPQDATMLMILCGLLGAVVWSWLMTHYGLPISLSHSLIGGLVGVALIGHQALNMVKIKEIVMWIFLAPVMSFVGAFILMIIIMWAFHRVAPFKLNKHFRFWQVCSSALMAFSHGMNDAQKAMGAITLALVAAGMTIPHGKDGGLVIPIPVILACATVIALGTGVGGWRVIRTLGHKMIKLMPVHGFVAETIAASTVIFASLGFKMPVSTTHTITAAITGVGASKRLSAVRWGVASQIVFAWIFTIPACGLAGAALYFLVHAITQLR